MPPTKTPTPPSEGDVAAGPADRDADPDGHADPDAARRGPARRDPPERAGHQPAVPALLLALALLGLAGAGGAAIYARRTGRLEGWGHAWREASYRATGAWGDFSDWLRLGR